MQSRQRQQIQHETLPTIGDDSEGQLASIATYRFTAINTKNTLDHSQTPNQSQPPIHNLSTTPKPQISNPQSYHSQTASPVKSILDRQKPSNYKSPPKIQHSKLNESPIATRNKQQNEWLPSMSIPEEHSQQDSSFYDNEKTKDYSDIDIQSELRELFLNYADFSQETAQAHLKLSSLTKMMKDALLIRPVGGTRQKLTQNRLSIIVSSECKGGQINKVNFDQFLNILAEICKIFNPNLSLTKEVLENFIICHLEPLLERIRENVEVKVNNYYSISQKVLNNIQIDSESQLLLIEIEDILVDIYRMYFDREFSNAPGPIEKIQQYSFKCLQRFLREFEVCPRLINAQYCYLIWQSVINKDIDIQSKINLGYFFTYQRFTCFIYRIAIIYISTYMTEENAMSNHKKFLLFLTRLETTEGFANLQKRTNKCFTSSITLIPEKRLYLLTDDADLKPQLIDSEEESKEEDFIPAEEIPPSIETQHTQEEEDLFNEDQYIDENQLNLKKLFEIYSSMGEPMNTKLMKSSKIQRLFKDAGLISNSPLKAHKIRRSRFSRDSSLTFGNKTSRQKEADVFQSDPTMPSSQKQAVLDSVQLDLMISKVRQQESPMRYSQQNQHFLSHNSGVLSGGYSQLSIGSGNKNLFDKAESSRQSRLSSPKAHKPNQSVNQVISEYQGSKLEFNNFIEILKQTCQLIGENFQTLLEQYLIPLTFQDHRATLNNNMETFIDRLQSEEMVKALGCLHKAVAKYYSVFTDNNDLMTFQQFMSFCSQFKIFPDLQSKPKLHTIFQTMSFLRTTQFGLSPSRNEYIDKQLFTECLGLVSLQLDLGTTVNSDDEKVIFLAEKMSQSHESQWMDLKERVRKQTIDKKDFLWAFQGVYREYFESKYLNGDLKRGSGGKERADKRGFQEIMKE